jgi:transposase
MTPAEMSQRIAELERQLADALRSVAELTDQNRLLSEQLEQARREAARQAAPFRRPDNHKKEPSQHKRPGRRPGHQGSRRPLPPEVDETHEVPLRGCPRCGGAVENCRPLVQFIEEIPPVRPRVHRVVTYKGRCPACGPVRSRHPLQAGDGHHASACQLGPRALALACVLSKHHGLTARKTCRVLRDLCGLSLSPGGLTQALDRLADKGEPDYQQLLADIRAGPAVYADETSWWVGAKGWWLHVFTSPDTTVFRVEPNRSGEPVRDTLGEGFKGVLVSDCLSIYDGVDCRQHKCFAHHQKEIKAQLDQMGPGQDRTYLEAWRSFFRVVSAVWHVWGLVGEKEHDAARENFAAQRDELLARPVSQEQDVGIRNRLDKQRDHLLTCLEEPESVEPTNNRAERALRPAVIARKVSCGNKTERGETTFERLASLAATYAQRGLDLVSSFSLLAALR